MPTDKPRFRRDLEAVPVEADGERYVEVRDSGTGKSFLFYDFEYRVALAFDGLALDKVIPWVKLSAGLELRVDQLQAFAASLEEMGFLEGEPGPAPMVPAQAEQAAGGSNAAASAETAADGLEAVASADAVPSLPPRGEADLAEAAVAEPAPVEHSEVKALERIATVAEEAAMATEEPPSPDEVVAEEEAVVSDPTPWLQPTELSSPLAEPEPELEPPAEVIADATKPSDDGVPPDAAPPANIAMDSTAFPVLPVPARAPTPESPSGPPPWTTPRPLMTPVPVTFGPILEHPSARRRLRRSLVLFGSLGILAAAAILALVLPFLFSTQEAPRQRVRVLTASPGSVFRYFDGAGVVQAVPGLTLKFPASGKITRIASTGSAVAAGDIAAAVESARPLLEQLTRQRERLAFYQQIAEAMRQVGNTKEEERQAAKVELRNTKIAKTLRALSDFAVVVDTPGVVDATFAREGDTVEAGNPALRLRSAGVRATFELTRQQTAQVRGLGFCQVEVDGYLFECVQTQEGNDETHASVEIASVPPSQLGKPAHLARARFEGAFVLPLAALVHAGSRDEVFVVSLQSRVETRPVAVAERDTSEAIVVQGLDTGDHVIVEVGPGLHAGTQVSVVR